MRIGRGDAARLMVADCLAWRQQTGARPKLVFSTNGQAISLAARDPEVARAMARADCVLPDGASVVTAARLLTRAPIPERVATTDFVHDAAKAAQVAGLRFFLLGASEEINAKAADELMRLYPGLEIAGRHHGYFSEAEEAAVCAAIDASGADVVWVGMGMPREQFFCLRNRDRIRAGWLITCGGCFNFLSGDYRRAPAWMQKSGLEWLHRMATGPRYLIWRYLVTNPHAIYLMLTRTDRDAVAPSDDR